MSHFEFRTSTPFKKKFLRNKVFSFLKLLKHEKKGMIFLAPKLKICDFNSKHPRNYYEIFAFFRLAFDFDDCSSSSEEENVKIALTKQDFISHFGRFIH